jgi:homoaconitase/3-isopropylmalate dehydratase large subunit
MGLTLAEKVLARASGLDTVSPGEIVGAAVDLALSAGDAGPVRADFEARGVAGVWDPDHIVIVADHSAPAGGGHIAAAHQSVREFVRRYQIRHFFDVGRGGGIHQVVAENGFVWPGMVVVGTDPHAAAHGAFCAFSTALRAEEMAGVWAEGRLWVSVPSSIRVNLSGEMSRWVAVQDLILYLAGRFDAGSVEGRALEFGGPGVCGLSIGARMVVTNLAAELGARAVLLPADDRLLSHIRHHSRNRRRQPAAVAPDADAAYEYVLAVDLAAEIPEPLVACPGAGVAEPVSGVGNVPVHQAEIGGCAGGGLEDLETAAGIVAGRQVHSGARLVVTPASQQVYLEALRLGYLETLVSAGALVCPPGCGPCADGHLGLLAPGETCISSHHCDTAAIYLASPAVVAASAVAGRIVHPVL